MPNKQKINAVWSFISTFVVTIIVITAIALAAARIIGLQGFTVESNSMAPIYPINSFVLVKSIPPDEIEVGDIITYVFNEDGMLVTHRVTAVDTEKETFITKGDNNNVPDASPVLWGNVVGKVVFGVPEIGSVLRIIMKPENKPYVIAAIAVIGIVSFALDLTEKKKRKISDNADSESEAIKNNEEK